MGEFLKESFLKNQYYDNSYRYGSVCEIKYRREKCESLPSPDGYPGWQQFIFNNRRIEHVYYPSMKKGSISTACGKSLSQRHSEIAARENDSVEKAVQQVAKRP